MGQPLRWVQRPCTPGFWRTGAGKLLYLVQQPESKELGLARVDADSGEGEVLVTLPKSQANYVFGMEVSTAETLYVLLEASDHPAELWRIQAGEAARLLTLNPDLEGLALGQSRLIEYQALDGRPLRAALLLPPGFREGERVPLLVEVYGGSMGSDLVHRFGGGQAVVHPQLLAAAGYALLLPDMPMAPRDPLRQLPGLVLPAVSKVVELGIADPERVGVLGNSYGGYCTLGLLVQTGRFRAAVANAGFYDLVGAYTALRDNGNAAWLGWAESGQGRMGGTLWEKRDAYIENSPLFYLDRVTTPLLLTCGTEDIVPKAQPEAVFAGLRRLGKPVVLAEYEREDHWPGMWSDAAYRDLWERVVRWFGEHLTS
ncbi:MAG: alpha/beta hydrolase family protein [Chloroflexota bacterium]